MMISTKGRYALRTMVDIAQQKKEGYVSLRDISQRQGISMKYLEQIVGQLARAGLLKSSRGAQGGYMLARRPEEYTAGDILRLTEGPLAPVACLAEGAPGCGRCEGCTTIDFWRGLYQAVDSYVDSVTLDRLVATGLADEPGEAAPAEKPKKPPKPRAKKPAPATPAPQPEPEKAPAAPARRRRSDIPIELL